jgi:ClpP class serine protease
LERVGLGSIALELLDLELAKEHSAADWSIRPLTEEMLATMTARNEQAYERFVRAMARNRGVSAAKVKSDFGAGEMMSPGEAKKAGLIDRIATLQDVLEGLVSAKKKSAAGVRWSMAAARLKLAEA